jgi:hypothetical protein
LATNSTRIRALIRSVAQAFISISFPSMNPGPLVAGSFGAIVRVKQPPNALQYHNCNFDFIMQSREGRLETSLSALHFARPDPAKPSRIPCAKKFTIIGHQSSPRIGVKTPARRVVIREHGWPAVASVQAKTAANTDSTAFIPKKAKRRI